jgi:hypothetical protein
MNKLLEHRKLLITNPNHNTDGYPKFKENTIKKLYKNFNIHKRCKGKENKELIKMFFGDLIDMVWEAQGKVPFFGGYDSNGLPWHWNNPVASKDRPNFSTDYVELQYGHILSRNNQGKDRHDNFTIQSARCNNHIQTSLNLSEAIICCPRQEVIERYNKVKKLHASDKWKNKVNEIEQVLGGKL